MHQTAFLFLLIMILLAVAAETVTKPEKPKFRALVLHENGGHHAEFSKRAHSWLEKLTRDNHFAVDYIHNTDTLDEKLLTKYQLFIQLDYPPYGWKEAAVKAFESYIKEGRGGWIGLHHASLLGEFDGFPMWDWYSHFMGDITYKDYISTFADARVHIETQTHPCMKDVPASFLVEKEEWYTYNQSPRPNVQVLATVDESTYHPDSTIKMGDHPVIWTNPKVPARNIYIFMGHSPNLFDNKAYTTLLRNSILWASSGSNNPVQLKIRKK